MKTPMLDRAMNSMIRDHCIPRQPRKKLTLPHGTTYTHDDAGNRVCTISQMGRLNFFPEDKSAPIKLRMERLRFVNRCYDQWGAYWGMGHPIYCAWSGEGDTRVELFFRAHSRENAKHLARLHLPNARFYN